MTLYGLPQQCNPCSEGECFVEQGAFQFFYFSVAYPCGISNIQAIKEHFLDLNVMVNRLIPNERLLRQKRLLHK